MLVVADLLGVPASDHEMFRAELAAKRPGSAVGSAEADDEPTARWSSSTSGSATTSRTGGATPTEDVMTGLATATFPDGSLPDVIDVVRIAANLFAAGQETTVRLLASALLLLGERPDLQDRSSAAIASASRTSSRRRCASRARSRATSGCHASPRPSAASTSRPAPR